MWKSNKYNGPGILITKNKFYYSGYFENGERKVSHYRINVELDFNAQNEL